nr:hypothetical protein Hi04_10k_c4998_00027 [uncultured bacterium]
MALADVQSALARLFTDESLRARFFDDPTALGRSLGLDDREASDLAGLSRDHVSHFAATLRHKRVDDARRYLPLTAAALGDGFAPHLLAAIGGPSPPGRHRDDARALVEDLATVDEPAWAADLARYELTFREAMGRGFVVLVRRFRYPVGRLASAIRRGGVPPEIRPRPTIGVWLRIPGRRGVVHRVL